MNTATLNAPIGNDSAPFNTEETASQSPVGATGYNYGYLDEQTKRMIRRALLKAVSIPGYQVPFGGREMPMPYGWGTGGVQITAAIIGQPDTLKVIDQGADDTTNAVSIREFFKSIASANTTEKLRKRALFRLVTVFLKLIFKKIRSWCIRCRSQSRCALLNLVKLRLVKCMRCKSTESCTSNCMKTSHVLAISQRLTLTQCESMIVTSWIHRQS